MSDDDQKRTNPIYGFRGLDHDEITLQTGLDPFGAALADMVGGNLDDREEETLEAELEAIALDEGLDPSSVDPDYDAEARRLSAEYAADAETGLDPFFPDVEKD